MDKKFILLACVNKNMCIGKDNKLLYHIKSDLRNFKLMTVDNVVIMGRKTFESLPNQRPLKDRINIIVTSNEDYSVDSSFDNVFIVHSLEEAKDLCETFYENKTWYIIGGGSIYHQALENDIVDECNLTVVDDETEGDTYIPNILEDKRFGLFYKSDNIIDEDTKLNYYFTILKRK